MWKSIALMLSLLVVLGATPATQPAIDWKPYSDDVFAQAKREHKLVILDLQAVWCHWCHVMDEKTYSDPQVRQLIGDHFLAIKVDQDSRPDISNRYEDFGWPATVVFDSDGKEIVKRRGYLPPEQMRSMLKAVIADPTPGPSIEAEAEVHPATQPALAAPVVAKLKTDIARFYDDKNAGWGEGFKFIDADLIEYCTDRAIAGDKRSEQMARQTLTAGEKLIDPAWGGVYQYSTDGDWNHPHFEKIMSFQADDMRTYARSFAIWHDPSYRDAAEAIHHFLRTFLTSPQGAFYVSQDADRVPGEHGGEYFSRSDTARRAQGIPRIDTHIYSRENGWAIASLVALHEWAGDPDALDEARKAADWIIANRSLPGGGFRHDEKDMAGPFLGDTLAMGRAFLDLYAATADRVWLDRAAAAADFISKNFVSPVPNGVLTSMVRPNSAIRINPEVDENIAVARFARRLYQYSGVAAHETLAEIAMRYLAAPGVLAHRNWLVGGVLLANEEMSIEPVHITIVGGRSDAAARGLFEIAATSPLVFKRVEWYDANQGPLMRMDVEYPQLPKAAAFVCANGACSSPIYDADQLRQKMTHLVR
jgi:uncharacterized protein YyaL (SSP411 family)